MKLSNYQQYSVLSIVGSGEETNVDKVVLDKSLSYIQKKDILQQAINSFSTAFIANAQKLNTIKEEALKQIEKLDEPLKEIFLAGRRSAIVNLSVLPQDTLPAVKEVFPTPLI